MEADVYVNNTRDYKCYYPQTDSKYYDNNCGLAVIVMDAKWFNNKFSKSIDEVREEIRVPGIYQ